MSRWGTIWKNKVVPVSTLSPSKALGLLPTILSIVDPQDSQIASEIGTERKKKIRNWINLGISDFNSFMACFKNSFGWKKDSLLLHSSRHLYTQVVNTIYLKYNEFISSSECGVHGKTFINGIKFERSFKSSFSLELALFLGYIK